MGRVLKTLPLRSRTTIADGSMRTGSAFQGICSYLSSKNGDAVLFGALENVAALKFGPKGGGQSNLEVAEAKLKAAGMWSMAIQTDPRLHGIPQSRKRIYQLCVRRSWPECPDS